MRVLVLLCFVATPPVGSASPPTETVRRPVAEYFMPNGATPTEGIYKADLSPDGRLVAYAHSNGKVTVHAVAEATPRFTTEPTDLRGSPYTGGAAFSVDGTMVAFPGKGKQIEVRSAQTGESISSIELTGGLREVVDALAFSPDGRKLAVVSGHLYHKDLHLFETTTGRLVGRPLADVDGIALQLVFSADGKRLAANHWKEIFLVDFDAGRLAATVAGESSSVIFFQDEKLFAVQEASLAVHEATNEGIVEKSIGRFAEENEALGPVRVAVAGNPAVAAVVVKNEVSLRNMDGRELRRVVGADAPIRRVCLSTDGRTLLVFRETQRVELFHLD
ncbi:MAG: WD40 repeat domain-containing protein [Planctomycetia bacterium]